MTTNRLNRDEKATYLLGAAVRRYLGSVEDRHERTLREVEIVLQSGRHGLTADEIGNIRRATGLTGRMPGHTTRLFDSRSFVKRAGQ